MFFFHNQKKLLFQIFCVFLYRIGDGLKQRVFFSHDIKTCNFKIGEG